MADAIAYSWGSNSAGQLGNSSNIPNSNVPVQVVNTGLMSNITAIASGGDHNLVIKSDGTVWAWGRNDRGQLGNGSNTESNVPIQVNNMNLLNGVTAVSGGLFHSLAVRSDGTVWSWGFNQYGQLGNGLSGPGTNSNLPVQVNNTNLMSSITAVSGGRFHSLARRSDGTIWAWGQQPLGDGTNIDSSVPVQVSINNVTAISAGNRFSLAIRTDGTVWSWGINSNGQLGDGTNNPGAAAPVPVVNTNLMSSVIAIAAGSLHGLALRADGTVWAWGDNSEGQLGNGLSGPGTNSNVPVQVDNTDLMNSVIAIAAKGSHSLALKADGTVWSWGSNNNGQLGNGSAIPFSSIPVQVDNTNLMSRIVAISSGVEHSLALQRQVPLSRGVPFI
ncbi:MAG: hypothetical protein N2484_12530 [Clostridia bacterium]|nr:hypothetical protein [Clostridia bacterium]